MESSLTALRLRDIPNRASLECELSVLLHHICCQRYEKVLIQSNPRRFNYQMQLNWFHRAFDKKAAQELGSLVSYEVCY